VVSKPLSICRLQGEGGKVDKENNLIHTIKWYQSLILSIYCRQREPEEKEDRVLKLCDDCCKVHNSQ
jgi:hypothetical protein